MARLKIGFIPIEGGSYYKEALEEVTRAEELGFDSVWMEEHHSVTNHYWPSPLTVLAGFATRTSRMMLGTDIIVAAFHHPVRLAEDVAMLDVMSGGRATLGIAIGYKPDEFALYGVDLEKRGARFEEQLAIIKGLWTQERVSFKGAYYTVEGRLEPKPVTRVETTGKPSPFAALKDPKSILSKRSVYFDYDKFDVKDEYSPLVDAHAKFLRDNPSAKMLIQGNADERGSREYNVGLGQRRSDSLKKRLTLLGAREDQIESVSLGEEKPVCTEHTEDCYAKNRRDDMLYSGEY